jgi:cbb3-type cytochrome oxidase maturation protein
MESIYILIPVTIVLLGVAVAAYFWAVRSGQFDDLDKEASRILFDDDEDPEEHDKPEGRP